MILLMVQKSGEPVEVGSFPNYLQGFLIPRWLAGCLPSTVGSMGWVASKKMMAFFRRCPFSLDCMAFLWSNVPSKEHINISQLGKFGKIIDSNVPHLIGDMGQLLGGNFPGNCPTNLSYEEKHFLNR